MTRRISTPHRIILIGRDNTHSPGLTSMQRERMEPAGFVGEPNTMTWPRLIALCCVGAVIWAAFFGAVLS